MYTSVGLPATPALLPATKWWTYVPSATVPGLLPSLRMIMVRLGDGLAPCPVSLNL